MMEEIIKSMPAAVSMSPAVQGDIWDFFNHISGYILLVSGLLIAPALYIAAAFFFLTAAGSDEKINKARNLILWTTIGLIIIAGVKAFFAYLTTIF